MGRRGWPIYRGHEKSCPHRSEGRAYWRCRCTIWLDVTAAGKRICKSLHTRNWEVALNIVREMEVKVRVSDGQSQPEPTTVEQAWQRFLTDAEGRKLHPSTVRKYGLLSRQMQQFAQERGLRFLNQLDLDTLSAFRAQWKDGLLSSAKKLERLKAFFHFTHKRKWVDENPASDLKAPKVAPRPTMPFTHDEMMRILAALDEYANKVASSGRDNARRLRALVVTMRYAGLRISDTVKLAVDQITGNRLFLYTQKTGVPVYTVLPDFVVRVLEVTPRVTAKHFFWSGIGKPESIVRSWQARLRKLFQLAKVPGGRPHRFRDTFAVELLLAGVPIERVSILLGHSSVKVTEKHYAPWTASRQAQVEADLERAWNRDPILALQTNARYLLDGKSEAVN